MNKNMQEIINEGVLYYFTYEGPVVKCCISRVDLSRRALFIRAWGKSVCSWEDIPRYNKHTGRKLAFMRALRAMELKLADKPIKHRFME